MSGKGFRTQLGAAIFCAAVLLTIALWQRAAAQEQAFRAPEGFEVTTFAGDDLAHDIYSMTIDAAGHVVVAGRGYIKRLVDVDGDGRADEARLISDRPVTGARGMYFDDAALICSGDRGLHRYRDTDGDGTLETSTKLLPAEHDGDHASNGIVKGPDGWLYWICGNDAGIDARHVTLPGSPVREPSCGALVRVSPDGKRSEVLADGFRNPYDIDFAHSGEVLTYDADGERDQYLPWYSPTRIFDIQQGMHHGWVLRGWVHAWNRPPYIPDGVERMAEPGRGSPTGVIVYRHGQFPERYRGGLLAACWSYGRVYFFPLSQRRGSTYHAETEIFLEPAGDTGFAPVDLAIGPGGDLFVAIGGRGTRGSVFRVRYRDAPPRVAARSRIASVLQAEQPLASWSRARWLPLARELGREAFEKASRDPSLSQAEHIRAIEILVEVFDGIELELARSIVSEDDDVLAARALWALGRGESSERQWDFLVERTSGESAVELRAAWDAIAALPAGRVGERHADWLGAFAHRDRRVRSAAVIAARRAGKRDFEVAVPLTEKLERPLEILGALAARPLTESDLDKRMRDSCRECLRAFRAARPGDPRPRLDAVRLLQLALGDVALVQDRAEVSDGFVGRWTGRVPRELREEIRDALVPALPSGNDALDRELARLFAMLEVGDERVLARLATLWTESSNVESDIHMLLAAARIEGARSAAFTKRSAFALTRLQHTMRRDRKTPSRYWPVRVRDAFEELARRDPRLPDALVESELFGLGEHVLFIASSAFDGAGRRHAILRLLAKARERGDEFEWTRELVEQVGTLEGEAPLAALLGLWTNVALRDAVALELARRPGLDCREQLVDALASREPRVVASSARALASLKGEAAVDEVGAALEALSSLCARRPELEARRSVLGLVRVWSGEDFEVDESGLEKTGDVLAAYAAVFDWFARRHPDDADSFDFGPAETTAQWLARMDEIDWAAGDAGRGRRVFEERKCAGCHTGASRLGPDLKGVTGRLARRDLFVAILEPSRDISPAHIAKEVLTRDGAVHRGALIYDSPAATLVQTSADTTVRLTAGEIREIRTSTISFMPDGLLADLDDRGVADLYTFLKTLR